MIFLFLISIPSLVLQSSPSPPPLCYNIRKMKGACTTIESKAKAIEAAKASFDKKAKDIVILELHGLTVIADYFVICSGESTTQVRAIVDHIEEKLKKHGMRPGKIEGLSNARWVLLDYGDVIVHVFESETRDYYELEKFWLDAPRIPLAVKGEKLEAAGKQ